MEPYEYTNSGCHRFEMPVADFLRAKKKLWRKMQEGEVLTVLATDGGVRPAILKRFAVRPDMFCWNRARPTCSCSLKHK